MPPTFSLSGLFTPVPSLLLTGPLPTRAAVAGGGTAGLPAGVGWSRRVANGDCGSQGLPCLVLEQASAAVSLIYDHFFKPSNLGSKKERSWVNTYLRPMHFSVCKESRTVTEQGEDLWEGLPQSLDCSPISRRGLGLRLDRPQGSQPRRWVGLGGGWAPTCRTVAMAAHRRLPRPRTCTRWLIGRTMAAAFNPLPTISEAFRRKRQDLRGSSGHGQSEFAPSTTIQKGHLPGKPFTTCPVLPQLPNGLDFTFLSCHRAAGKCLLVPTAPLPRPSDRASQGSPHAGATVRSLVREICGERPAPHSSGPAVWGRNLFSSAPRIVSPPL